jgi:hypothetical protein
MRLFKFVEIAAVLFFLLGAFPLWADPTTQPRVQQTDIEYLGAFRLPQGTFGGSRFGYGGRALTYYKDTSGRETLFMQGHDWYPGLVAQVQIPEIVNSSNGDGLRRAILMQGFNDITEGRLPSAAGDKLGSMMVHDGKLIVGSYAWYDATNGQKQTIGTSSLDLATTGDFSGFYPPTGTNPGRLGRYMTPIPDEWQSLLGGPAMNGACCISIIGRTNYGPGVSVFDPDDVGSVSPVPVNELIRHTIDNPARMGTIMGGCGVDNDVWNCSSTMGGIAFPTGTRSVLFFGSIGLGPVCYKNLTGPSSCWGTDGYYAPPYRYQIWAYDANDLAAVKNGQKQSWQVEPYALLMTGFEYKTNTAGYTGVAFDPDTNRVFLVEANGEDPIIHVIRIKVGNSTLLPPSITSSGSAFATKGTAFSYQIAATNGPTGFNAVGLPSGLTVNAGTGLISGTPSVAGTFNVTLSATNASGTRTKILVLTVSEPGSLPLITAQPRSRIVNVGQVASFSVIANGAAPLSYQWQSRTSSAGTYANISGANNSAYITPATVLSQSGWQFRVIVTNSAGSVTSNGATLTIYPNSTILPAPTLNLPEYLPLNAEIPVTYSGSISAVSFEWSFIPLDLVAEGALSPTMSASSSNAATFRTSIPKANLGNLSLTPGRHRILVSAVDANNNQSAPAQAEVTLVAADLSGVRVYPNPWRSDRHATQSITFDNLAMGATIKIMTLSGHHVKTLSANGDVVRWDLKNESGEKAASGIYIYLIKSQNEKRTGKLILIK